MPDDGIGWKRVVCCREFWSHYYELHGPHWPVRPHVLQTIEAVEELLKGREVQIPLPEGYALAIDFGEDDTVHRLQLLRGRRRQLLGWQSAHFYPDVFRWTEFERIVEAARQVPEPPLPRWAVFLLLYTYVGLTAADDLPAVARAVRGEFASTGLFNAREVRQFRQFAAPTAATGRMEEMEWVRDPERGWVVEGGYSLRAAEGDYKFDFAPFRRFIRDYE